MAGIPLWIELLFIGIVLGLFSFLVFLARYVGGRKYGAISGIASKDKIASILIGILSLWLALTAVLASRGGFADFTSLPPRLLGVVGPAMIGVVLLVALPRVRRFIAEVPLFWLILIQAFRIPLEWILHELSVLDVIPQHMTFSGLNFDVLTGLTALPVGWLLRKRTVTTLRIAGAWNVLGLLLVLNILVISILSTPSPFRVFMADPANTFIADFPFVWLPAFVVPLALLFHLWTFVRIGQEMKSLRGMETGDTEQPTPRTKSAAATVNFDSDQ